MLIRKATTEDIETLIEMRFAFLTEEHGAIKEDVKKQLLKQLPAYFLNHLNSDLTIYIAEINREILSVVFLIVSEKPANISNPSGKFGGLFNVYTKPEFRRQGISKKILETMIEEVKQTDIDFIELKATKDGYPLYQKLGFQTEESKYPSMKLKL